MGNKSKTIVLKLKINAMMLENLFTCPNPINHKEVYETIKQEEGELELS